jgi:hypothetical protein
VRNQLDWWKYATSSTPLLEELLKSLVALDPHYLEREKQLRLITRRTCSGLYCVGDAGSIRLPELRDLFHNRLMSAELPFEDLVPSNHDLEAVGEARYCVAMLCRSIQVILCCNFTKY